MFLPLCLSLVVRICISSIRKLSLSLTSHPSMASLTIIPYIPIPAKPYCSSSNQDRAKDVFKCINDHDEELQIKQSILPGDTPQPQATAVAENASNLATHEKDGNSMNDHDGLPLERQASHVSACADQSQNHPQQCLDKGASVSRGESGDVEYERNTDHV